MTDPYTSTTVTEDIDDAVDTTAADLDRQADAILAEGENRTFDAPPLRQAVRRDAAAARDWSQTRVQRLCGAVEQEPVKATLVALGVGVLIGLLAAR